MLSLHYNGLPHGLCAEIINTLKPTRHIHHTALKVMLSAYRPIIRIRTDQVTPATCFFISPISTARSRLHPLFRSHFSSTLNPEQHVPHPHCNHLILELSIHLRQRHRSLQEEDQERSPFPSTPRQTPELSFSRCRPQHTLRTNSRFRPISWD